MPNIAGLGWAYHGPAQAQPEPSPCPPLLMMLSSMGMHKLIDYTYYIGNFWSSQCQVDEFPY